MKFEINIRNTENIDFLSDEDIAQVQEVMNALVSTGGLTGVKGGQTVIHFDADGVFQKIELKYYPWTRRASSLRR